MPYITAMQTPKSRQLTFEDILYNRQPPAPPKNAHGGTGTVTYFVHRPETIERLLRRVDVRSLIIDLESFISKYYKLWSVERSSLYRRFHIPKRSGGLRQIDAPNPELMNALRELKTIFEQRFGALYHTSAFAYVPGRSTVDAIRRHQQNGSRWFLKTDFSNFFGSTTQEFLFGQLSQIFPFSEVVKQLAGEQALMCALNLCFLDGGLPQGTPISPFLTNLMMIPFDHRVSNALAKQGYVYTRYADDILISHFSSFDHNAVVNFLGEALQAIEAPFEIKPTKTRYGSNAGSNWNLGVMLNKDNQITIGRKKKENLKAACFSFIRDLKSNVHWDPHDVCVLSGNLAYYKMIEPDWVDGFIRWFNEKHGVNLKRMIRDELS